MEKIFGVLIGVLIFFSFDCFANFDIWIAKVAAIVMMESDIEYKKEIDNLKKELNECKKSLENNNIY